MRKLLLGQAIVTHKNIFMEILSDCIDTMTPLREWFSDIDWEDPDLSDMRAIAYEEISYSIMALAHTGTGYLADKPGINESQALLRPIVTMLVGEGRHIDQADYCILAGCIEELAHNANQSVSEMFRVEHYVESAQLEAKFEFQDAVQVQKHLNDLDTFITQNHNVY